MTLMVLLSCLVALIFLAVVAWALIQINTQLAAIGGREQHRSIEYQSGLPVLASILTPQSTTGEKND